MLADSTKTHPMLGRLPGGWRVRALGDVLRTCPEPIRVEPERTFREIGIRSHGKGIFHKAPVTGADIGTKRVFRVRPGCLVFNIVFAWEGAVAVTGESESGMIASHRFPMYEPRDRAEVDVGFLRRFFQTPKGIQLLGDASPGGAGRNRTLNQKFLSEVPLPLPPLREQQQIAAMLSSVDDVIERGQAVIAQLHLLKKAMMQELLTRGLPRRHTRFKKTEIGEVPEAWALERLGSCGEWLSGGTPSKARADLWEGTVPWVSPKDMMRSRISDATDHVSPDAVGNGTRLVQPGTILAVVRGMILAHSFPVALATASLTFNQDIKALVPDARFDPEFLLYWLQSRTADVLRLVDVANHGTKRLPTERLFESFVPIPPTGEQIEIVGALSKVDVREEIEKSFLRDLQRMKPALMSALLTGDVRVNVDKGVAA